MGNPSADMHVEHIRLEGQKDPDYTALIATIRSGFSDNSDRLQLALKACWAIRHETVEDDIALWGCRMIIPNTLRKVFLSKLHASPQGQDRTLRRARHVFTGRTSQTTSITKYVRALDALNVCHRCHQSHYCRTNPSHSHVKASHSICSIYTARLTFS